MASIEIPNPPQVISLNNFRAIADRDGSLAKSTRFATRIRPIGDYIRSYIPFVEELTYLTEIAEIPGRGFMNIDVRYYGPNHKLPFQTQYEDMNMTFLCRNRSRERQFFDDWMLVINPVNSFDFNYRDSYRAEIDVYQMSDVGLEEPIAEYWITMHNAYPLFVNPQPVTWGDEQFQRLVVSFTYTHWSRYGLDPRPRMGEPEGFSYDLVEGRNILPRA